MIQVKDLNIISTPPTWRRMIDDILSRPIPMISGVMDSKRTIVRFEEYFSTKKNKLEKEITELNENINRYKERIEKKQYDRYWDEETLQKQLNEDNIKVKNKEKELSNFWAPKTKNLPTNNAAALLALKNAVHDARSISLDGHKVILGLTGGMAAEIVFRERGDLYPLSDGVVELYSIASLDFLDNSILNPNFNNYSTKSSNRFENYMEGTIVSHALYYNVYLNSPIGFCFLTEFNILEIYFHPAPMLFGNGAVSVMSAINKVESDKKSAEDDERRRKEEDDEYWRLRDDW